jgi:hypothetical protein
MHSPKSQPFLLAALALSSVAFAACDGSFWAEIQGEHHGGTTPPPPPPPSCVSMSGGGDKTCKSGADWKLYATQACEAAGLALGEVTQTDECSDGGSASKEVYC